MPTSNIPSAAARRFSNPAAFTLIELLVVLAIIGILTTIAVVLAGRVTGSGKERLTTDVIRVLDTTLTEFLSEREKVPALWKDQKVGGAQSFAMFDGRLNGDPPDRAAYPSLEVFLLAASETSGAAATIKGIDAKLLSDFTGAYPSDAINARPEGPDGPLKVLSVRDAWGKQIRFVHPAFHGGYGDYWNGSGLTNRNPLAYDINAAVDEESLRRSYRTFNPTGAPTGSVGDADEGVCPGNRPYFYSVGPDGDPGAREDNVYSTRPTFPGETAKFN